MRVLNPESRQKEKFSRIWRLRKEVLVVNGQMMTQSKIELGKYIKWPGGIGVSERLDSIVLERYLVAEVCVKLT